MASAIQNLRKDVQAGRKEGCHCPICGQFCKEYKRQITLNMVKQLQVVRKWFNVNDPNLDKQWCHVNDELEKMPSSKRPGRAGGDFALLRHWGLVIPRPGTRDDGSTRTGYWRITKKGIQFLDNLIKVPKYALVYNNKLIMLSDEAVDVHDCLRKKFSYNELMSL